MCVMFPKYLWANLDAVFERDWFNEDKNIGNFSFQMYVKSNCLLYQGFILIQILEEINIF